MKRLTAAVVGLGRIGQGYDYDCEDDSRVLTHAGAFTHHEGFTLVGAVDPDPARRAQFERKFARPAYGHVHDLASNGRPDVWAIAVPTDRHFEVFQDIVPLEPRAVLCEKPIAVTVADAQSMVAGAAACGCALVVNYIRRFEPGVLALRRANGLGELGEILKGVVWYTRGLLNNGSHFIDLLRFLLGDVTSIQVIAAARESRLEHAEPDVCIHFGRTPVCFLAATAGDLALADMTLIGSKAMIRLQEGGRVIKVIPRRTDPMFPAQTILSGPPRQIETDVARYQWHVADAVYRHLVDRDPLDSDGVSATATLEVVAAIHRQIHREQYV